MADVPSAILLILSKEFTIQNVAFQSAFKFSFVGPYRTQNYQDRILGC